MSIYKVITKDCELPNFHIILDMDWHNHGDILEAANNLRYKVYNPWYRKIIGKLIKKYSIPLMIQI